MMQGEGSQEKHDGFAEMKKKRLEFEKAEMMEFVAHSSQRRDLQKEIATKICIRILLSLLLNTLLHIHRTKLNKTGREQPEPLKEL